MRNFKILLIGERSVGKSSIRNLLSLGYFSDQYIASSSLSISTLTLSQDHFTFYDCSEITPFITQHQFSCIFLIFDLNSPDSFSSLKQLHTDLQNNTCIFFIVGNKSDLPQSIPQDDIQNFSHETQSRHFSISCKTGHSFEDFWQSILDKLNSQ